MTKEICALPGQNLYFVMGVSGHLESNDKSLQQLVWLHPVQPCLEIQTVLAIL